MSYQAGYEDGVGSVMGLKTMCPVEQEEVWDQDSLNSSRSFQCSKDLKGQRNPFGTSSGPKPTTSTAPCFLLLSQGFTM